MWHILYIFGVIWCVVAAPTEDNVNVQRNMMIELISSNSYESEHHNVITEDGYILSMYRIPYARYDTSGSLNRPVVFVMHGLFGQSLNFIMMGPDHSLAYNLADAGYDVWLGNYRGNIHSRHHQTLDPDDPADHLQFFDFSWEDIALYDISAMIDYILAYTNQEKLHYIGHSQGGTVFLVLASMRPEYMEKLSSVQLLAGVGYQEYFPDESMKQLAQLTDMIYAMAIAQGTMEATPDMLDMIDLVPQSTRAEMCPEGRNSEQLCNFSLRNIVVKDVEANITGEIFGGGSLKQVAHYGQNIRDLLFRRFHYGTTENQEIYGSEVPPLYDLSLITTDVIMHYTLNDNLLDERDVLAMAADMPNTIVRKVARETFEHNDFIVAEDARELVSNFVVGAISYVHEGGNLLDYEEEINDVSEEPSTDPQDPVTTDPQDPVTIDPQDLVTPSPDSPGAAMNINLNVICKVYLLICSLYVMINTRMQA